MYMAPAPASASAAEAVLISMSSSSSIIVESGGAIWKGTTTRAVCVMDASGPLGSSLVHRLLLRGYSVHAAFHNRAEMQSFQRICMCSAWPAGGVDHTRLKVFHSDPLDYHSILDALKGCCGLFYSFRPPSPSDHDHRPSYHDESMAEMEVRAAHNVLEACAQTHTIDKVVFTSSATAVIWSDRNNNDSNMPSPPPPPPPPPPHDIDEKNWSNVNFCKKFKLWHGLSKTLAERTAWALAVDRGVNMVSINGGLLMTPDLTITSPYLKGAAEMYEDGVFVTVDLRFLVDSHICVFEDISAYGRYLSFNHVIDSNDKAVKLAHMLLPPDHHHSASDSALPTDGEESREGHPQRISNKKLSKLMLDFDHTTARVPT